MNSSREIVPEKFRGIVYKAHMVRFIDGTETRYQAMCDEFLGVCGRGDTLSEAAKDLNYRISLCIEDNIEDDPNYSPPNPIETPKIDCSSYVNLFIEQLKLSGCTVTDTTTVDLDGLI